MNGVQADELQRVENETLALAQSIVADNDWGISDESTRRIVRAFEVNKNVRPKKPSVAAEVVEEVVKLRGARGRKEVVE